MNRLLYVSRQGGFPWVAETVDALNQNARYIEAIMDGFNISNRQAIILSNNIIYLKDYGWASGKIVKTTTRIPAGNDYPTRAALLANPSKYTLKDISQTMSIFKLNSDTEKYKDCILFEEYEIALAESNNQGWTFFEMVDLFERGRWMNVPSNQITIPHGLYLSASNFIKYDIFQRKIHIRMVLPHNPVINDGDEKTIDFKFHNKKIGVMEFVPIVAVVMKGISSELVPISALVYLNDSNTEYVSGKIFLNYKNIGFSMDHQWTTFAEGVFTF